MPGGTVQKSLLREFPGISLLWRRYGEKHAFVCDQCHKDIVSRIVVDRMRTGSLAVEWICNGCYGELVASAAKA